MCAGVPMCYSSKRGWNAEIEVRQGAQMRASGSQERTGILSFVSGGRKNLWCRGRGRELRCKSVFGAVGELGVVVGRLSSAPIRI